MLWFCVTCMIFPILFQGSLWVMGEPHVLLDRECCIFNVFLQLSFLMNELITLGRMPNTYNKMYSAIPSYSMFWIVLLLVSSLIYFCPSSISLFRYHRATLFVICEEKVSRNIHNLCMMLLQKLLGYADSLSSFYHTNHLSHPTDSIVSGKILWTACYCSRMKPSVDRRRVDFWTILFHYYKFSLT